MTEFSITDARDALAEILNRAAYAKERLVLTRHGKKLVAVVPVEDLELLEEMEDRRDALEAESALRAAEGEPRIPWEQVKKRLGLNAPKAPTSGRPRGGGRASRSAPRAGRPRSGK
jgi:prevent-host-death family protein